MNSPLDNNAQEISASGADEAPSEYEAPLIGFVNEPPRFWAQLVKKCDFPLARGVIQTPGTMLYRLKDMPSRREPVLRTTKTQYSDGASFFNLIKSKVKNIEAIYCQVISEEILEGEKMCTHCAKELGLYAFCVRVPGEIHCANCHHGGQSKRCSFNNAPTMPLSAGSQSTQQSTSTGVELSIQKLDTMIGSQEEELSKLRSMVEQKLGHIKELKELRQSLAGGPAP
ncbi:hypothetical protein N7494_009540 [Penicillium frequentans]|uniref:Uncharacterized protein n=1 Tax=Penicillium frequentans TaxID=3151616 RepID=A0AAD6CQ62_9EURO|nr:hypothetical protein N7494_009540 [Penicillium glabrum]